MKAPVIFVVLAAFVIFDGEGTTLHPFKAHSARPDLHNPTTRESAFSCHRTSTRISVLEVAGRIPTVGSEFANIESSPLPGDRLMPRSEGGRGPPFLI